MKLGTIQEPNKELLLTIAWSARAAHCHSLSRRILMQLGLTSAAITMITAPVDAAPFSSNDPKLSPQAQNVDIPNRLLQNFGKLHERDFFTVTSEVMLPQSEYPEYKDPVRSQYANIGKPCEQYIVRQLKSNDIMLARAALNKPKNLDDMNSEEQRSAWLALGATKMFHIGVLPKATTPSPEDLRVPPTLVLSLVDLKSGRIEHSVDTTMLPIRDHQLRRLNPTQQVALLFTQIVSQDIAQHLSKNPTKVQSPDLFH